MSGDIGSKVLDWLAIEVGFFMVAVVFNAIEGVVVKVVVNQVVESTH